MEDLNYIDLIITDVMMPHMDGLSLVKTFKIVFLRKSALDQGVTMHISLMQYHNP